MGVEASRGDVLESLVGDRGCFLSNTPVVASPRLAEMRLDGVDDGARRERALAIGDIMDGG